MIGFRDSLDVRNLNMWVWSHCASPPLMAAGLQSPQNGETATGQLLMQHSSTTLLDFLAEEWDDQVTEKVIRRFHAWNMQYNPKPEIKGDYVIDVKSATEYKNKQMYIRDMERLSMEAAQNPTVAMAINMDELIQARLSMMHLPSNRIVKNKEEFVAAQQAASQQPDPAMIELQLKQKELEQADRKLALEEKKMQFELQQQQQREAWEHEEKMGSNRAREIEAQASVIREQTVQKTEMIKLAAKGEQFAAQLANDREMHDLDQRASVFMKSMEEERKNKEIALTAEELAMKERLGSGI